MSPPLVVVGVSMTVAGKYEATKTSAAPIVARSRSVRTSGRSRLASITGGATIVSDAWRITPARFFRWMRSLPELDRGSTITSDTATLAGGGLPTVTSPRWIAWNGYWLASV